MNYQEYKLFENSVKNNEVDEVEKLLIKYPDILTNKIYASNLISSGIPLKSFREGHLDMCKLFLKYGIGKNYKHRDDTPISSAIYGGQIGVAEYLFSLGDIDTGSERFGDILILACYRGNARSVRYLLGKGMNPHKLNSRGKKSIQYTLNNDNTEVVKALLEHDISLALEKDDDGINMIKRIKYRSEKDYREIIDFILSRYTVTPSMRNELGIN